jgi:A/G-specific adenine glycosylase
MVECAVKNVETIPLLEERFGIYFTKENEIGPFKHVFSHLTWEMNSISGKALEKSTIPQRCKWLSKEELQAVPMPVPMLKIWQAFHERGKGYDIK